MKRIGRRFSMAECGFTLVEVMIALLLTVTVMASVFGLLHRGSDSFRREPEISDLNQNARSGVDMISRDLLMAGFKTPAHSAILWSDGGLINPDEITVIFADPDFRSASLSSAVCRVVVRARPSICRRPSTSILTRSIPTRPMPKNLTTKG